jgi:hypothetical protein
MKIGILDCDSIAYTIGHGNKIQINQIGDIQLNDLDIPPVYQRDEKGRLVYTDKTEEQLIESCNYVIGDILNKGGFTHYVGFIKGSNTIKHKLTFNPTYKQDRKLEQPKWWNFVKDYLVKNYNIFLANDFEVDDYVVSSYKCTPNSHIVAIDSDILAIEGTHYNWRKNEWITVTKDQENFAFWSQMITGNHNNIKGLPGKGIKYAENVLKSIDIFKDHTANIILIQYIDHYKNVELAIDEFYKNYKSLKVIDNIVINPNIIKEWTSF